MTEPEVASAIQWQEAVLKACSDGRLDELQKLFDEHGIRPGSPVTQYYDKKPECPPTTSNLFAAAISQGHQEIIRYLYSIYPKIEIYDGAIPAALMESPLDAEMLRLVCSHTPEIASFEYDDRMTSLLSKACEGGAENAPFIHVLLDHGALAHGMDHSYTYRMGGPLTRAVECDQPVDVIRKMARGTPHLDFPINSAVYDKRRADVLDVLLSEQRSRGRVSSTDLSGPRSWLEREKDKDMIDVIERHIKCCEQQQQQQANSAKKDLQATKKADAGRWWPFRGERTRPTGMPKDQGNPAAIKGTGPSNSWWHLSKKINPSLQMHSTATR